MKAVVAAFNQEKALVGAFSVIMGHYYVQVSNMTKKMINCTHLQLLTQVRRQAAGQWDQDEEEVR